MMMHFVTHMHCVLRDDGIVLIQRIAHLSGWCSSACRRNASLICCFVAVRLIPRTEYRSAIRTSGHQVNCHYLSCTLQYANITIQIAA